MKRKRGFPFSIYSTTFLAILLLSGYAAVARVADSDKPGGELQEKSALETAGQKEGEDVLAIVNGEKITMNEYNEKLKRLSVYEKARYRGEEGHKEFLNALIRHKLMVQRAERMGLDEDEEVQKRIEILVQEATERVLIETLVERDVMDKVVVSNKEAKAYYDKHEKDFRDEEKVRVRHILVATEEEARNIRQGLEKGADFAKLAEEKSIDQSTAKQGGDLGYFERGKMAAEFEKVCFDLKVGEVSDVVRTRFGYHVVKLEDKREASVKEFYEVSDEIKKKLISEKQREEYGKWLRQLEKEAKIEMNEGFFKEE